MTGLLIPGANLAGRDRPTDFPDVPAFLTVLAAAGLQDRLQVPEPDAGVFPSRLLDVADVLRSFPADADMKSVDADGLLDFLPSSRPGMQELSAWRREIKDGQPLPTTGRQAQAMALPRLPDYIQPANRVPSYPLVDAELSPWLVTSLDPAWPMRPQVTLPVMHTPLIDNRGHMQPWITYLADRLEHVAAVMTRRRMQYAAAKVVLSVKDGPLAPSKEARVVASDVRGAANAQLAAFAHAATYLAAALWSGLIDSGDVPVIQPAQKAAKSLRLTDASRRPII